ncbi:MAG: signal recognition particle receptor subunit alpha, partial [Eggerthellaceae bacterium]|nr:signal recognition particle receptor subunit alpha [Eggerthellaceae bacterium]
MGIFDRISNGLARSRERLTEQLNVLLDRGPNLDEGFWEGLEEALILSDVGPLAAAGIVGDLRDAATRKALPDAFAVLELLYDSLAASFAQTDEDIFATGQLLVLFVGVNGSGKTTTVGKIAFEECGKGRKVLLGSADT